MRMLSPLAITAGLALASGVRADNLHLELNELAAEIQQVAAKQGQNAVAIGEFTGSRDFPSSAGPEIQRALIEALGKLKQPLPVNEKAQLEVKGDYRHVIDAESKETVIKIAARILNNSNETVATLRARAVHGNAELAGRLGVPSALDPAQTREERNKELERRLPRPGDTAVKTLGHVEGSLVSAAKDSPFAVEILVRRNVGGEGQPRAAGIDAKTGLPFVELKRDEFYEIRLINKAPFEAAARLTIDGLDQFVFSDAKDPSTGEVQRDPKTGRPVFQFHLVAPGKDSIVKGWYRHSKQADSFVVTEYAKTAAAKLHSTAKLGTIVVQFHAAWEKDADRPADETGDDKGTDDGTGQGPPVAQDLKTVQRNLGVVRATVAIRYTK